MKKNEKFEIISKTECVENGMPRVKMVPMENNVLFCLDYFALVFDMHDGFSWPFFFLFVFRTL